MTVPILAVNNWPSNAELIRDVARIGYLRRMDHIVDMTYGRGTFWKLWKPLPGRLVKHDVQLDGVDFRELPHEDETFDVAVFDPPYKLNGTPSLGDFDARYGIGDVGNRKWRPRMQLIADGFKEACRVVKVKGKVLVKCQDQVCSGQMRWQTDMLTKIATDGMYCMRKVDRFDMLGGGMDQPAGRSQVHARGRGSTLLVFEKEKA